MPFSTLVPSCRPPRALLLGLTTLCCAAGALPAAAQVPANDEPCGATVLTLQGPLCMAPTVSTNVGATVTTPNGYPFLGHINDVWFRFTTAATGPASFGATITVNGNAATVVRLFAAASCAGPFASIGLSVSNQANTTAPRLIVQSLLPGTTYYVQVAGRVAPADLPGPFTICVSDGPSTPCGLPTVVSFTGTGATTGTVVFAPGVNNVGPFTISIQNVSSAGPPSTSTTGSSAMPLPINSLQPGFTYTATVTAGCVGGGQVSSAVPLRFTVPLLNDEPCGAIALPLGPTCVGASTNLTYATPSNVTTTGPPNCAAAPGTHDVWYTVTTPASGTGSTGFTVESYLTFNPAGTLRVYEAASCAGPFNQLGCSTGGGASFPNPSGAAPLVLSGLSPATTYYVRVDEGTSFAPNLPGAASLCVLAVPACAKPTGLSVANVAPGAASVQFVPGNSNVSYTAAYWAAGVPVQTATGAAPPIILTGLLPGTAYTVTVRATCRNGNLSDDVTTTFTTLLAARHAALAATVGLHPNPATGRATLTLPVGLLPHPAPATLRNALGQRVRTYKVASGTGGSGPTAAVLDLAGLPPGVYVLHISTPQGAISKRLVVE